jgi:lipid II:glycine glycyltransferase (peptidoglycan interpeptide bridge formation enzyme)
MTVADAPQGAYLHTSGTSAEGMASGASHFLLYEIMLAKQKAGVAIFNLGGVRDMESGLAQYKRHFGADSVALEAAEFSTGGLLQKLILRSVATARAFRRRALGVGQTE